MNLLYVFSLRTSPGHGCNFRPEGAEYTVQKLILGTHTSDSEQNYLMVADVRLPSEDTEIDARKYDEDSQGKVTCLPFTSNCCMKQSPECVTKSNHKTTKTLSLKSFSDRASVPITGRLCRFCSQYLDLKRRAMARRLS